MMRSPGKRRDRAQASDSHGSPRARLERGGRNSDLKGEKTRRKGEKINEVKWAVDSVPRMLSYHQRGYTQDF